MPEIVAVITGGEVNEYTLVKIVPGLPRRWEWYGDANVVALHPCIDTPEKRSEALAEVYAHWRRSCIQVVPSPADEPPAETLPITIPHPAAAG